MVAEDITERKGAEAVHTASEGAMRELNETLEQRIEAQTRERFQIWNVSQDLLLVADRDGKDLSVNPAWTASLGWLEAGTARFCIPHRPAWHSMIKCLQETARE